MANVTFTGFDGWSEGPGIVDLRVGDQLFDLHNNANLLGICHRPAEDSLSFEFAYSLDWERLGGIDDREVVLRFLGVRQLNVVQAEDADSRTGHDLDGITFSVVGGQAMFVVAAAECEWSFEAGEVVLLTQSTTASDDCKR